MSQRSVMATNAMAPTPQAAAELPSGQSSPGQMGDGSPMQGFALQGPGAGSGYFSGGCADGYCTGACSDPSCGAACGDSGCCNTGGRCFFTADYLLIHPSFSESTAFIRQDLGAGTDTFVPLDFDYNSSYRFGGGYRLPSCGDEIRFLYTRMNGNADAVAFPGDIVPFAADPPPDGRTNIRADVNANVYDLECAKTIPLGGNCSGCGDACGKSCPAWDITWSGGVRWADVGWNRSYVALDDTNFPVTDARTSMDFDGGGFKTGLEGRRYFGCDGWLSLYSKGNISLLLGDVRIHSSRSSDDGNTFVSQTFTNRQLIPVFDLEAGLTAQVTCHTAITAGYLMSAWSDLGFRNAFDVCGDCGNATVPPLLATKHDDANMLGFDGLFIRFEYAH